MWWSGLSKVVNQSSYTGWNNSSSRSYHARQVKNGKIKSGKLRSEGEVVLLTIQRFDGNKLFPSENQHNNDAAFAQGGVGLERSTLKVHISP
uniref:GCM domain-containing protein n=1 Tax=Schistosoma curassoni TaxID=6186 RepID=A0A183KH87_9TREM